MSPPAVIEAPRDYEIADFLVPVTKPEAAPAPNCLRCPETRLDLHPDRCRLHQVAKACRGCAAGAELARSMHCLACGSELGRCYRVVRLCTVDLLRALRRFEEIRGAPLPHCLRCKAQRGHHANCSELRRLPWAPELLIG